MGTLPPIRIPLSAPLFTEADETWVLETLRSGWVSTASPSVTQFEQTMAHWLQVPEAVALNSGTAALHLALRLINLQPGDEVIVPALSFIATVNPVLYQQATPVFADVDPSSLSLSVETVKALITPKTKAIIVTHLFGLLANVNALKELAEAHGVWLIEDAAEALGARWQQKPAGTWGHLGCFSFNGNKTLTTGSGGLLVCPGVENGAQLARGLSAQARTLDSWELEHHAIGYNYRMNALAAALGLSQLQQLTAMVEARRAIAKRYASAFKASQTLGTLLLQTEETPEANPSYWLSCLLLHEAQWRQPLAEKARAEGIEVRPVFKPLPLLEPFKPFASPNPQVAYPNALHVWQHGLCLPCSHWLSLPHQQEVIDVLHQAVISL